MEPLRIGEVSSIFFLPFNKNNKTLGKVESKEKESYGLVHEQVKRFESTLVRLLFVQMEFVFRFPFSPRLFTPTTICTVIVFSPHRSFPLHFPPPASSSPPSFKTIRLLKRSIQLAWICTNQPNFFSRPSVRIPLYYLER